MSAKETGVDQQIARLLAEPWIVFVARACVATPFLLSGLVKMFDFQGAIGEVRGLTGLENGVVALTILMVAVHLVGSLLLAFGGRHTWLGALSLAGFTAIATVLAHAFWTRSGPERVLHQNIFFEHVAITGGIILVAAITWLRRSPRAR